MTEKKRGKAELENAATATVEEIEIVEEVQELSDDDLEKVSGGVHFDPSIPRISPDLTPKSFDVPLIATGIGDTSILKKP